jgi:stress-induced morphogen
MNSFLKLIEEKVKKNIIIESIAVIDNSHKHKKHIFFDSTKYHLCLEIHSKYLNSISKINAQREVMKALKDEMTNRIHALEIKIK